MLSFENAITKKGFHFIVGLDEAGRGPLAGPVVASAVCLRDYRFSIKIQDSKKMTKRQREMAFLEISKKAYVGMGLGSVQLIDQINILNATFKAMANAVVDLVAKLPPSQKKRFTKKRVLLLVDGNCFRTALPYPFQTIVKGDQRSLSIACASIMAKVTRDKMMEQFDRQYPQYGFQQHKGYPTLAHRKMISTYGLCEIHRKTFRTHTT